MGQTPSSTTTATIARQEGEEGPNMNHQNSNTGRSLRRPHGTSHSSPQRKNTQRPKPYQTEMGRKQRSILGKINMDDLVSVNDYHEMARRKMPKMHYDYYRSGAEDMITLTNNQQEFRKLKLRPRVLVDVSGVHTGTTVLQNKGEAYATEIAFPVIVAPTAMHKLAHADGECATARGAADAGTIFSLSSLATTSIADVATAVPRSPKWFQLYILKDREFTANLVRKAEENGYSALLVTVDAPKLGNRESDHKNKFHLPEGLEMSNLLDALKEVKTDEDNNVSALNHYFKLQIDDSLSWKDIAWLRTITKMPIIVKGVITAEDAKLAVECMVDGIVVSNHGARQCDTTVSTIEALPEVVETVKAMGAQHDVEIYIDGGITRGTDVLKALALGAKAVLVGRPVLWGLAVGGAEGVNNVLRILQREFTLAMQLCGCERLEDITSNLIFNLPPSRLDQISSRL